ncbi:hypothetical protein QBC34DRAFT_355243 [Podospora aff. communis PSN243]|uniref:(4-O-methyl)-D-glucuronate--lignin esterase n=1 Tax=Podospora aff. communis PSN243 TaxID=3040156 RepID=A0AAV9GFX9_9PEZI|nr:hypothetical protein QBC34DRAFT_355243 [Podospora aff. communis PSN243]
MSRVLGLVALLSAGVSAQQSLWGQCGGNNWNGLRTCVSGSYCSEINPWYHQCIPGAAATTAAPPPPPTTTLITTTARPPTTSPSTPSATSNPGSNTCPATPGSISFSDSRLPDPFTFVSGAKVTSLDQWTCRREEISTLIQRYELGTFPPKPSSVTSSFSGSSLSITVSHGGKSISFSVTISNIPSGAGPHPAIIAYGMASIPVPAGVATITFNNDQIAAQQSQSSRGSGRFYDLYGSSHSAGALTAWAWGVSRIIDALEQQQSSTRIDPTRIGVTGCSRNGKGAIVAGALEPRVALTIPQESGAGGAGCWRLAKYQKSQGSNVQDAPQIVTENVWFSRDFNAHVNNVDGLPFDHHMLAGMVAPRGLYVIENTDMEWLGKLSTYGCMAAARKIYQGLGVQDRFGYSQVGGNSHCSFNAGQQSSELSAFINRFLLGRSVATGVLRAGSGVNLNVDTWTPWTVPSLG